VRKTVSGDVGTLIYSVPTYRIPENGPTPQRDVDAAAILTSLMIANTSTGATTATIWVVDKVLTEFTLASSVEIALESYARIDLDKQVLLSGEEIYISVSAGDTAEAHLSFVLNQREEFTVIV